MSSEIEMRLNALERAVKSEHILQSGIYNQSLIDPAKLDGRYDLAVVIRAVWSGKWVVILLVVVFGAYSLSLPNVFKSEVLLTPAEGGSDSSGGLAGQIGGWQESLELALGGRVTKLLWR